MKLYIAIFVFITSNAFASEPEYIMQGRKWLAQWGEVYCIKKHTLHEIEVSDIDDSFHFFDYSEVINSLIFDNQPKNEIFQYIDENIENFANLINGKHLNLLACIKLTDSDQYNEMIKKQDRFLYQHNAGIGAIIRADGQKAPFSGSWRMISKYDTYEAQTFHKGDVFPVWKSNEGIEGNEWVLEFRDDGGDVKIDVPYF